MLLILTKPEFIYDNEQKKYRQFGRENGKTIFTLPIIAIFTAVIIAILFNNTKNKEKPKKSKKMYKYIYIPVETIKQNIQ